MLKMHFSSEYMQTIVNSRQIIHFVIHINMSNSKKIMDQYDFQIAHHSFMRLVSGTVGLEALEEIRKRCAGEACLVFCVMPWICAAALLCAVFLTGLKPIFCSSSSMSNKSLGRGYVTEQMLEFVINITDISLK